MGKHYSIARDQNGDRILYPEITIYEPLDYATGDSSSTLATVYTDQRFNVTAPNPLFGDADGNYSFFAPRGRYRVRVRAPEHEDFSEDEIYIPGPVNNAVWVDTNFALTDYHPSIETFVIDGGLTITLPLVSLGSATEPFLDFMNNRYIFINEGDSASTLTCETDTTQLMDGSTAGDVAIASTEITEIICLDYANANYPFSWLVLSRFW